MTRGSPLAYPLAAPRQIVVCFRRKHQATAGSEKPLRVPACTASVVSTWQWLAWKENSNAPSETVQRGGSGDGVVGGPRFGRERRCPGTAERAASTHPKLRFRSERNRHPQGRRRGRGGSTQHAGPARARHKAHQPHPRGRHLVPKFVRNE